MYNVYKLQYLNVYEFLQLMQYLNILTFDGRIGTLFSYDALVLWYSQYLYPLTPHATHLENPVHHLSLLFLDLQNLMGFLVLLYDPWYVVSFFPKNEKLYFPVLIDFKIIFLFMLGTKILVNLITPTLSALLLMRLSSWGEGRF